MEDVGILHKRPFGLFKAILVFFPLWYIFPVLVYLFLFWYVVPRKIWQPCSETLCLLISRGANALDPLVDPKGDQGDQIWRIFASWALDCVLPNDISPNNISPNNILPNKISPNNISPKTT
jgi:hypothetical protein